MSGSHRNWKYDNQIANYSSVTDLQEKTQELISHKTVQLKSLTNVLPKSLIFTNVF